MVSGRRILICGLVVGMLGAAAVFVPDALRAPDLDLAKAAQAEAPLPGPASDADLDRLLAEFKAVTVDDLAGSTWQHTCLSRGEVRAPVAMDACWPAVTDRNLGGSFVNVIGPDGACSQWRTTRPVIHKRFEDSFCVARADVPDLTLRDKGRLVDVE